MANFDVTQSVPTFNFAGQKSESDALLDRYSSAISGMTSIPNIYQKYADQFGVQGLMDTANQYGEMASTLGNQVRGLPKQIAGRTQESLLTQGQKDRMVQSESAPMLDQMGQFGTLAEQAGARAGQAQQMAGTLSGLEMQDQNRSLLPFEQGFNIMEQRQAREFSGYTFREQAELDRLMQNKRLGFEWSNAEAQRAADLSLKELQYKEALNYMKQEYQQKTVSEGYIKNL